MRWRGYGQGEGGRSRRESCPQQRRNHSRLGVHDSEVVDYFEDFEPEDHEDALIRALRVGVATLELSETSKGVEFVKSEFESMQQTFTDEIDPRLFRIGFNWAQMRAIQASVETSETPDTEVIQTKVQEVRDTLDRFQNVKKKCRFAHSCGACGVRDGSTRSRPDHPQHVFYKVYAPGAKDGNRTVVRLQLRSDTPEAEEKRIRSMLADSIDELAGFQYEPDRIMNTVWTDIRRSDPEIENREEYIEEIVNAVDHLLGFYHPRLVEL